MFVFAHHLKLIKTLATRANWELILFVIHWRCHPLPLHQNTIFFIVFRSHCSVGYIFHEKKGREIQWNNEMKGPWLLLSPSPPSPSTLFIMLATGCCCNLLLLLFRFSRDNLKCTSGAQSRLFDLQFKMTRSVGDLVCLVTLRLFCIIEIHRDSCNWKTIFDFHSSGNINFVQVFIHEFLIARFDAWKCSNFEPNINNNTINSFAILAGVFRPYDRDDGNKNVYLNRKSIGPCKCFDKWMDSKDSNDWMHSTVLKFNCFAISYDQLIWTSISINEDDVNNLLLAQPTILRVHLISTIELKIISWEYWNDELPLATLFANNNG